MPEQNQNAYWRMGGITVGAVEDYLYSMLPPRDEVLAEMEAEAARRKVPIVGPAVGRIAAYICPGLDSMEIYRIAGRPVYLPHLIVGLTLTALLTVLTGALSALFGPQNPFRQPDEGAGAHIFQLAVAALVPMGLLFLATADWSRPLRAARPLALSAVALILAVGALYYFEHS